MSGLSLAQRSPTKCGVSEHDNEFSIMRRPWPSRGLLCCGEENKKKKKSSSSSQQISCNLWELKVHYHVHNSLFDV